MTTKYIPRLCATLFVATFATVSAANDMPFCAIRLRKPQTDSPEVWNRTLAQFAKHRGAVDEVWFSTGICFPKMDEHRANAVRLAAAAEDLRKLGILPSLQVQSTIGHGDAVTRYADNSGIAWQTYTAADGAVADSLNCPRAPGFLAYLREMASLYAAAIKPYSVWIDDDIRIVDHHAGDRQSNSGWGCHCDFCIGEFSKRERRDWTRPELVEAARTDAALEARWRAFAFEGEANLARTIAEAVHASSPATRMCQQQPMKCFPEHRRLYEAHHEATGLPVGMRPGAGAYCDHDARAQIDKAYILALQIDTIGPLPFIDRICPEIETCPRTFACRTGRGVLLEALEALSQGMNSISALAMDAGYETPEWYGEAILAPLAKNASMLKRYVEKNDGALRCGYGVSGMPEKALQTSSLPLMPLVDGAASSLARLVTGKTAKTAVSKGSEAVKALFAEDLVLDGAAADVLFRAGYGAEIGLAGCLPFTGGLRERFTDDAINVGFLARETPVSGASFFLEPALGARVLGEYFSDANAGFSPRPATVAFETAQGRRRVVFGSDALNALVTASGDRIVQMHRLADWASHGKSPVLIETPTRSFVQPRVHTDGTLASIVFVNATIDATMPVKLRLRGVPPSATEAVWSALDAQDVAIQIARDGSDALVELPPVPAWTGGYLYFR